MFFAIPYISCRSAFSCQWLLLRGWLLLGWLLLLRSAALDDGQHLVLAHDQVLLAIELDLLARVLAEEDQIARFDIEGHALALVVPLAVAGRNDPALLGLLLGRVRDDDPADLLAPPFKALNDDPIV